jgi:hypothetical protein
MPNARCVNRGPSTVGSAYAGGYEPIYGGSGTTGLNLGDYFRYSTTCPSGSTWNNTTNTCNCPSGQTYNVNTDSCYACTEGQATGYYARVNLSRNPVTYPTGCDGQCAWRTRQNSTPANCYTVIGDLGNPDTYRYIGHNCWYATEQTGAQCTIPTPQDGDEPPQECPAGHTRMPDGSCKPQGDCPVGQVSINGTCQPSGDCPAGQRKAPDGSCVPQTCPAGQVSGGDGTCKPDTNNDGEPDEQGENEPNSFSGGDKCDVPPSCSGDAIMCGMARIQWRIDCNTRKNRTITGGHCGPGGVPICTGEKCDSMEYSHLLLQWRATCELEKGNAGAPGEGEDFNSTCGTGKGDVPCEGEINVGPGGNGGDFVVENDIGDGSGFDTSGYGWMQSCPTIPPVTVFGETLDFNSKIGPLCEWVQLGGVFLMISTGITCLVLLIRV